MYKNVVLFLPSPTQNTGGAGCTYTRGNRLRENAAKHQSAARATALLSLLQQLQQQQQQGTPISCSSRPRHAAAPDPQQQQQQPWSRSSSGAHIPCT
ncbi:hypothetical protein ETH_00033755 [Eimeria tenella]|uniref:Uncharacterized protein n=1 Tax=Eimeria tenella TaxID=5802 RepID=U6KV68_EIMTE|nr:hypothetical protein ETH_00033755 [Eimeria tenella]CDJ40254.1 hypothetical protein ETH_00033755 [Eimeria tenella]|eukprot:XP_013231007.1 hypothetical protein ETH_00033755 [Eimeria tenella]